MTEPTRYSAVAARLLRERPLAKASPLSRDVGIGVVANAMALGRRRRRNARFGALAVGFAAAALFAFGIGQRRQAKLACHDANCASAARGHDAGRRGLDAGQSIVAPAGAPTSVILASGTQIALDEKSVLECRESSKTQRFALLRGGAHLHVSKLSAGERFLVDTPNAEVEVRGTVFGVRIEPATATCSTRTSVSVEEGRVEVRAGATHTALVGGDEWTSPCETPAVTVTESSTAPRLAAVQPARAGKSVKRAAEPVAGTSSALSEQNDLYARAEEARRGGRTSEALAAYAQLLAAFPHGQLAESALVERARLLAPGDRQRARIEAERYLARYPTGFARSEMEVLARAP